MSKRANGHVDHMSLRERSYKHDLLACQVTEIGGAEVRQGVRFAVKAVLQLDNHGVEFLGILHNGGINRNPAKSRFN